MKILFLPLILLFTGVAQAAPGDKPEASAPLFSLDTNPPKADITIDTSSEPKKSALYDAYGRPLDLEERLKFWNRMAGGFWLSMANSAVVKSHFAITSDDVLVGKASEFGFGLGAMFDLPLATSGPQQNLRFRVGLEHMSISPNATVLQNYSVTQLEGSATVLALSAIYRYAPSWDIKWGTIWYGGGLAVNNAFTTSHSGANGSTPSHLDGTTGINVALAAGADIEFAKFDDISVEFDYYVWSGYTLFVGYRTSL